jgi:hypothetical protein
MRKRCGIVRYDTFRDQSRTIEEYGTMTLLGTVALVWCWKILTLAVSSEHEKTTWTVYLPPLNAARL